MNIKPINKGIHRIIDQAEKEHIEEIKEEKNESHTN